MTGLTCVADVMVAHNERMNESVAFPADYHQYGHII